MVRGRDTVSRLSFRMWARHATTVRRVRSLAENHERAEKGSLNKTLQDLRPEKKRRVCMAKTGDLAANSER